MSRELIFLFSGIGLLCLGVYLMIKANRKFVEDKKSGKFISVVLSILEFTFDVIISNPISFAGIAVITFIVGFFMTISSVVHLVH